LPSATSRFICMADGMASLVPLAVVLIVVFGKPHLIGTAPRWEAAFLLIFITMVDLFGGYTFKLALSSRTMDVTPVRRAEMRVTAGVLHGPAVGTTNRSMAAMFGAWLRRKVPHR
jgi:hypothetical protein